MFNNKYKSVEKIYIFISPDLKQRKRKKIIKITILKLRIHKYCFAALTELLYTVKIMLYIVHINFNQGDIQWLNCSTINDSAERPNNAFAYETAMILHVCHFYQNL